MSRVASSRRADPHRHRFPEPDHAAVAEDPRQCDAAAENRAAVRGEYRAKKNSEFKDAARRFWRKSFERVRRQISLAALRRDAAARLALRALVHDPQLLLLDDRSARSISSPARSCGHHARAVAVAEADRHSGDAHLREAGYLANRIAVMRARPAASSTTAWCRRRPRTMDMIYDRPS